MYSGIINAFNYETADVRSEVINFVLDINPGTAVQDMDVQNMAVQDTPIQGTAVQDTPIQGTAIQDMDVQDIDVQNMAGQELQVTVQLVFIYIKIY